MKVLVSAVAFTLCAISSMGTAMAQISVSMSSVNCGSGTPSSFPVLSWSLAGTNTDKPGTSGNAAGVASMQNMNLIKTIDSCSADLIRLLVSGAAVPTVTLTQTAADSARPYNLVTVTMTDVFVTSYTINGGASPTPTESVQLSYGKVCFATVSLSPAGAPQAPQTVCYSPSTNVVSSY